MKKVMLSISIAILLLQLASSFMMPTHDYLSSTAIETYQGASTEFYKSCSEYPELCFVGNTLTDISVAYYYVNKGTKYEITHSPGFCINMLDNAVGSLGVTQEEEFACAVGSCEHASQDLVSHGVMVPYAIRHTGLPNEIIHVFAEQHLDNNVQNNYPWVRDEVLSLEPEDWNKCIPLLKRTLEGYNEYENDLTSGKTDDLINTFISEVYNSVDPNSKTGYDLAFKNKVSLFGKISLIPTGFLMLYIGTMLIFSILGVLLMFKRDKSLLNWMSMFIFIIIAIGFIWLFIALLMGNAFDTLFFIVKPLSNLVPIGSSENILDSSIRSTQKLFSEGESYIADLNNPKIASGFEELRKANEDVKIFSYIVLGFLLLSFILLVYYNFKKTKKQGEFLL